MRIEITAKYKKLYLWIAVATFLIYVPYAVWSSIRGDWFNLGWLLMPPFYFFMYYNYQRNMVGRYIQWDNEQIEFLMPLQKQMVKLKWSEISNVEVKVLSIELKTKTSIEKVDLNAVTYENIKTIKKELPAQFQKIKSSTAV